MNTNERNAIIDSLLRDPSIAGMTRATLNGYIPFGFEVTTGWYDPGMRLTIRGPQGSGIYFSVSADDGDWYTAPGLMYANLVARGIIAR